MNDIKNDEPHSSYKRLEEDIHANPEMKHSNSNSISFTNQLNHPNPVAMAYPNSNTSTNSIDPLPILIANPNIVTHSYPNAIPMSHSNTTEEQGITKFSTSPSPEDPNSSNEPPKDTYYDATDIEVQGFDFSEKLIRKSFIRKVYGLLMCQLLLTVAIITLFKYCHPIEIFMKDRDNVLPVCMTMGVLGMVILIMTICTELRRKAPWNFIFLGLFTVTQGVLVGIAAVYVRSHELLLAFGITAAIVFSLTLFAFQTKWDFTTLGGCLLVFLVALTIFGSLAIFLPHYRTLRMLYSGAGVVLFSFYIVYDTQLMIGGRHKYSISPEEYVFAALTLYLDILRIFIELLRLMR